MKHLLRILFILFLTFGIAQGADQKVSELPAPSGGVAGDDKFYMVDDSGSVSVGDTLTNVWTYFGSLLTASDVPIVDAGGYFEGGEVEAALQKNGFLLTDITDDVALNRFTVSSAVSGGVWTVTITQDDGLDLAFNIDKVHLKNDDDTMSVIATSFAGTDASPNTVYVYVRNVTGTATLTASNTSPEGVLEHVDVANYKAGAVSASSLTLYGGFTTAMTSYEVVHHTYHRFWTDGSAYYSGMDITAVQANVTIATGSLNTIFDTITTTQKVVGTDGLFHILNAGTYSTLTDFAFTHYSTGEAISANKFYNVVLGVVEEDTTRIMALVQKADTIPGGKEYKNSKEATEDKYGTLVLAPSDTLLKGIFIPVCRIIIKNDVNDYLQEIPETGTGLYAIDLRGSKGGGGSVATASNTNAGTANNDSLYWNNTSGEYDYKTPTEARVILNVADGAEANVVYTGTANEIDLTGTAFGIVSNPIIPGNEKMQLPAGTTGTRPGSPSYGDMRFNSSTDQLEFYLAAWAQVVDSADIGVSVEAADAAIVKSDEEETISVSWTFADNVVMLLSDVDASEADQGAAGNGQTVNALIDAAAGNPLTLRFKHTDQDAQTVYTFDTDETIPSTVSMVIENGAALTGNTGDETLTVYGSIQAGLHKWIQGTALTIAGSPREKIVYPEWWGANGDGTGDDTAEVQYAIDTAVTIASGTFLDVGDIGCEVRLNGQYNITSTVKMINADGVGLVGTVGRGAQLSSSTADIVLLQLGDNRYKLTVVDYSTIGVADTITIDGSGITDTTLEEGDTWDAETSNDVTATNIAAAIDAVSGISASAVAAVVTVTPDTGSVINEFWTISETSELVLASNERTYFVHIENIIFAAGGAIDESTTTKAIEAHDAIFTTIRDCKFNNWAYAIDGYRFNTSTIDNCLFTQWSRANTPAPAAIALSGRATDGFTSGGNHITNCEFRGSGATQDHVWSNIFVIRSVDGLYIQNCHLYKYAFGINFTPDGTNRGNFITDVMVDNCYFDEPENNCVIIGGTVAASGSGVGKAGVYQNIKFANCYLRGMLASDGGLTFADYLVYIAITAAQIVPSNISFHGGTMRQAGITAIRVDGTAQSKVDIANFQVKDVHFEDNAYDGAQTQSAIMWNDGDSIMVDGCSFGPDENASTRLITVTATDNGGYIGPMDFSESNYTGTTPVVADFMYYEGPLASGEWNIANEGFASYALGEGSYLISVMAKSSVERGGQIMAETAGTNTISIVGGGSDFEVLTVALNGTTGNGGKVTASVDADGVFYLENQIGGTLAFAFKVLHQIK